MDGPARAEGERRPAVCRMPPRAGLSCVGDAGSFRLALTQLHNTRRSLPAPSPLPSTHPDLGMGGQSQQTTGA